VGWGSQKDICGEKCPWKLEEYKVYVCVFVRHGLRSTSFVLGVAKKSEVPIFSARTSLTYPSSIRQAGTRTTAGDPWLWKLQRNKHELPVNTPSPNTNRLLVLQISPLHSEGRQYFFSIVPPQHYWPLLHVCRFLYSLIKRSQPRQFLRVVQRTIESELYSFDYVRRSCSLHSLACQQSLLNRSQISSHAVNVFGWWRV